MPAGLAVDHRRLYRLPWSLPDNAISWLEPTSACNLSCDGCPDMTLWNGELVWSCRMEELKHFGCWIRSVPCAAGGE